MIAPSNSSLNSDEKNVLSHCLSWENKWIVPFSPRQGFQGGCEVFWGVFRPLGNMLITWLFFQQGKSFCTFSCTEFNKEFDGTIRFCFLILLCWEKCKKTKSDMFCGTPCSIQKLMNEWPSSYTYTPFSGHLHYWQSRMWKR